MSKNQFTGTATQPQCNRKFYQFNKDQYCTMTYEIHQGLTPVYPATDEQVVFCKPLTIFTFGKYFANGYYVALLGNRFYIGL